MSMDLVVESPIEAWKTFYGWFTMPLFSIGEAPFSAEKIFFLLFMTVVLFIISGKVQNFMMNKLLKKKQLSSGSRYAVASLVRYVFVILGFILLLSQAGIKLSTLTVAMGALGVGIGFGLQSVTNNVVSGILILFEKPVQIGDRVEVDGIEGNVKEISLRATTVVTNDNVSYIIPNSEFVSETVINWSHGDRKVRRRVPVGVAYHEDPEEIKKILLEVAEENADVMDDPAPDVLFKEFGDSSLNFELRVWTSTLDARPGVLTSRLNFAISKKFKKNNISIPFPQRDIYIKEQP